jgi:hypothetical protein
LNHVTDANTLKRPISDTADTPLWCSAVTSWNSADVTITVLFGYY